MKTTTITIVKQKTVPIIPCPHCGEEFVQVRKNQKFCSKSCCLKVWRITSKLAKQESEQWRHEYEVECAERKEKYGNCPACHGSPHCNNYRPGCMSGFFR